MNTEADGEQGRREFLRSVMRCLSLTGLVSISGILWARRMSASPEECINLEICSGCPAFRECDLPLALEKRNNQQIDKTAKLAVRPRDTVQY